MIKQKNKKTFHFKIMNTEEWLPNQSKIKKRSGVTEWSKLLVISCSGMALIQLPYTVLTPPVWPQASIKSSVTVWILMAALLDDIWVAEVSKKEFHSVVTLRCSSRKTSVPRRVTTPPQGGSQCWYRKKIITNQSVFIYLFLYALKFFSVGRKKHVMMEQLGSWSAVIYSITVSRKACLPVYAHKVNDGDANI